MNVTSCTTPLIARARRRRLARLLPLVFLVALIAPRLSAQASPRFDSGIVVDANWLQANALPLDRDAMQSASFALSLRRHSWSVEAGFLRIARSLSTVQGASISVGPLLHWKRLLFLPTVGAFGGQADASRDSTGYDFIGTDGIVGHQARFSYSSAASFGGSVGLALEVPLYRMLGVRASASQWYFSGAPLDGDRSRTVIGAGLSLRVWQ